LRRIYDLGIKAPWRYIFQWPLMLVFIIDFHLSWWYTKQLLRGDVATNISSLLARVLALIGAVIRKGGGEKAHKHN